MTTWAELKSHINKNYSSQNLDDNLVKIVFNIDGKRSQTVLVEAAGADSSADGWIKFQSPIGKIDEVDVKEAAARVANLFVGIVIEADLVWVTNATQLKDVDLDKLDELYLAVTFVADFLEEHLTGKDNF
jgi:hypothetical protein